MKFLVKRTSQREGQIPCEGAVLEKFDYIDKRTYSSFEEYDKNLDGITKPWLSEGINHRVIDDGKAIERTFPDALEGYFIEINTLEELVEFKNKYGKLVFGNYLANKDIEYIEIYDDRRE